MMTMMLGFFSWSAAGATDPSVAKPTAKIVTPTHYSLSHDLSPMNVNKHQRGRPKLLPWMAINCDTLITIHPAARDFLPDSSSETPQRISSIASEKSHEGNVYEYTP